VRKSLRQALGGALRDRLTRAQIPPITDPHRNTGECRGGQAEDVWIQLTGVQDGDAALATPANERPDVIDDRWLPETRNRERHYRRAARRHPANHAPAAR
jgi:hypothetical protein